jgi:hypothetical protein
LYESSGFRDDATEEADAFVTVTPRAHYINLFTITSETSFEISMENTFLNSGFSTALVTGSFIA